MMKGNSAVKTHREPLFHIAKRDDMVWWKAWTVRVATILVSVVFVGFLSMLLTERSLFETFEIMQSIFNKFASKILLFLFISIGKELLFSFVELISFCFLLNFVAMLLKTFFAFKVYG